MSMKSRKQIFYLGIRDADFGATHMNRQNFAPIVKAFLEKNALSVRKTARAIGCSEPTLNRLLEQKTFPSDEMLRQAGTMIEIGFSRFSKLSRAEKEKISEIIGTGGGGAVGFASITATVGVVGGGLSAAGISSGLATLGGLVLGGMPLALLLPQQFQ